MSLLVFPPTFVSSAYVPIDTMPNWLRAIAEHQPITYMVDAVRALTLGDQATAILGHDAAHLVLISLLWMTVWADRRRAVPPADDAYGAPRRTVREREVL